MFCSGFGRLPVFLKVSPAYGFYAKEVIGWVVPGSSFALQKCLEGICDVMRWSGPPRV